MTVLVGVLCQDGVVVGSDSSATFSAGPHNTIEQPVQKTFVVEPDVIFATTGAAGLGQRLHHILQNLRTPPQAPWPNLHHIDNVMTVCGAMIHNMGQTFLNPGQIGALLAFACQDSFHLCEFAVADFQPEMKDPDMWFVSMGSGQLITDPFFGLLRRTLFREARPTLAEGVLAAYWALHNAIQLNTGGINGPIQLAVLRRPAPGSPLEARVLTEDELAEHANAITGLEDYLAAYRQQLVPAAANADPLPEPPPANG